MITATGLELRAGSRILLADATCASSPATGSAWSAATAPARPPPCKVLAGEGLPYARHGRPARRRSATCRRTRAPATWTSPRRDRVLSARGLDVLLRRDEGQLEAELADDAERTRPIRRYGAAGGPVRRARRVRGRGRGRPDLRQPRACPTGCWPRRWARCPAASAAGSSWPGSCSRDAAENGGGIAAAGRADQPPRRRLDHLAARLPRAATRAA